jgi:hypothetical protein
MIFIRSEDIMPINIKYLDNGIGVDFIGAGIVKGKELIEATEKIFLSEEKIRESRYGLLDFSGADFFNASSEELKIVTQLDKRAAKINPDIVIALITEKGRAHGLSQIWKAYMDETDWESKTFISKAEAINWIKQRVKEKFGIDITVS